MLEREKVHTKEGRLLYVDSSGRVFDIGAFTLRDIASLSWAYRIAYRVTRERHERIRLAGMREFAHRIDISVRRIESERRADK